jgi:antitoxin (DNA-binding transcriptional repressor) of toxin-antitoxin stability system
MGESIGVAELRRNLGVYVRRAGEGERLLITNRDQPVAQFGPLLSTGADEVLIEEATRRLSEVAPGAEVVLFGPHARQARGESELDLIVIEPDFDGRRAEFARLRRALRGPDVTVELVLYRWQEAEERRGVPDTFLFHALREGRVLIKA